MPRRTSPSLTEAVAEFQETRETYVAQTTLRNDWSLLRKFTREMGPDKQVHTITQRQLELWFAREAKRQKASSYNKVRTRIVGFVNFCQRRGWVTSDLMGEVRTKPVTKRERMRLSPTELLDLPNHTHTARDRAFIVTACNTALRANELCSLRIRDVDLHSGYLSSHITKSAKEDAMPITAELDVALREWFEAYEDDAGALQPEWFLFPQREPGKGRYIETQGLAQYECHIYGSLLPDKALRNPAQIVQRALISQGHSLEPGEGCHTLRRSVARAYFDSRAAAGYDGALRETSALLHHSSSQVTEHYLGLTTEKLGRDRALKGQNFLTALVGADNVTPIKGNELIA